MKKPIGKLAEHTRVDDAWVPVGFDAIEALDNDRRGAHHPASWVEVKLWVWMKTHRGAIPSVRAIQDWAQWTKHQAAEVRRVVEQQHREWAERFGQNRTGLGSTGQHVQSQNRPATPNDSENLRDPVGQESDGNRTGIGQESDSCARSSYTNTSNSTSQEREGESPSPPVPNKQLEKVVILEMWDTMCAIRADVFPGSQRMLALLPAREQKLRACLNRQKLKPKDLIHLTRWFFTSEETQWVREKGYHFDTMLRPGNVARFYEKAQGWSPERDQQDIERRLKEGF